MYMIAVGGVVLYTIAVGGVVLYMIAVVGVVMYMIAVGGGGGLYLTAVGGWELYLIVVGGGGWGGDCLVLFKVSILAHVPASWTSFFLLLLSASSRSGFRCAGTYQSNFSQPLLFPSLFSSFILVFRLPVSSCRLFSSLPPPSCFFYSVLSFSSSVFEFSLSTFPSSSSSSSVLPIVLIVVLRLLLCLPTSFFSLSPPPSLSLSLSPSFCFRAVVRRQNKELLLNKCVLMQKVVHGKAPQYLKDDSLWTSSRSWEQTFAQNKDRYL